MASPTEDHRDKTVTGYPAPPGHVTSGFPAGSVYPSAVQPPSASMYIHQYRPVGPPHRSAHDGFSFLCRFFTAAVAVFSIMGLTFFITWLVLKPHLPEFRVESANFYPVNATGSELTATWDLTFRVTNPNHKLSVYYDRLEASILFGDDEVSLSTTQLPPFFQPKKNETTVRARLGVIGEYVGDEVVSKISENRAHGSVSFGVRMFAWMRFRTGAWRMREHLLRIYCEPVEIGFFRNNRTGTLKGQSKLCEVDLC